MAHKPIQIDRDKLRAAVRKLGNDYVFSMLDEAIELLPPAKLHKIAKKPYWLSSEWGVSLSCTTREELPR